MGSQRVVDIGQCHLVVRQGNDAGILLFYQTAQAGDGLHVAIAFGVSQGIQFGSLLVETLLQIGNLSLLGLQLGVQFAQSGVADTVATFTASSNLGGAFGATIVQLVNQVLDLCGLCLN